MRKSDKQSHNDSPGNEDLLALWLDGQLNKSQQQAFEQRCVDDHGFAGQVEAANMMSMQADNYHSQAVPKWDRLRTFERYDNTPWWQWRGFASVSFATSMLAIVMVLSGMQVKMDDGALTISFADKHSSQDIDRLLQARFNDFQQTQQSVLTNYAHTMQQQQLEASTQLTGYLLSSSRQERREDFAELIKFINEQRSDDQMFYARQLNKLHIDIYAKPVSTDIESVNQ